MIDFHCHILRGIDDGADCLETSCVMLKLAVDDGIKTIITTPHYQTGIEDIITARHEELYQFAVSAGITLLTGCEYTLMQAVELKHNLTTLNSTSYLLVDLNSPYLPPYIEQHIFNIELNNYRVILAHPEKLLNIGHLEKMMELLRHGVYFQINAASVLGFHGGTVKKLALKMIQCGLCHLIASDAHNTRGRSFHLSEAASLISKEFSADVTEQIFECNPELMLQNKEPNMVEFKRKTIFSRLFSN